MHKIWMKPVSIIQQEIVMLALVSLASVLLVFDLWVYPGEPATFDLIAHITTAAQYAQAFADGEWFPRWANGFANYGFPLPLFSHQIPSYLGGLLTLLVGSPLLAIKVMFLFSSLGGSLGMYWFLRLHFGRLGAMLGTVLFTFSSYRIFNVYVRGALPEFFSTIVTVLTLIAIHYLFVKKRVSMLPVVTILLTALTLTHPMILLISTLVFFLYVVCASWGKPSLIGHLGVLGGSYVLALGMAAYYLIPLVREVTYLHEGHNTARFVPESFMGLANYFYPYWPYVLDGSPYIRGNFVPFGLIESSLLVVFLGLYLYFLVRRGKPGWFLTFTALGTVGLVFLTTSPSLFLYDYVPFLENIQLAWRVFSLLLLFPPIIAAYLFDRVPYRRVLIGIALVLICFLQVPQMYGKNYTVREPGRYYYEVKNLHNVHMNTLWMGKSHEYPVKTQQYDIIGGMGEVQEAHVTNARRRYTITGEDEVRMVDYTFYFPGWKVFVDGQEQEVQFQDPAYRGVITYMVPPGEHEVEVVFTDTKVRLFAYAVSVFFVMVFGGMVWVVKKGWVRNKKFKIQNEKCKKKESVNESASWRSGEKEVKSQH